MFYVLADVRQYAGEIPVTRLYDALGWVAMIATPLAAAVLFGWNLYGYLTARAVPLFLAIPGGIAGAVAIESVGIYAGHVGMDYARRRDWRGLIAGAAMAFYVYVGWSKTPDYGVVFVLAAFVYVLVALRSEASAEDKQQRQERQADTNWQRRLQLEKERMRHEERLARIAAKPQPAQVAAQPDATGRKLPATPATVDELTDAQRRVYDAIKAQPDASYTEIGELLGISRQAVSGHVARMNGVLK